MLAAWTIPALGTVVTHDMTRSGCGPDHSDGASTAMTASAVPATGTTVMAPSRTTRSTRTLNPPLPTTSVFLSGFVETSHAKRSPFVATITAWPRHTYSPTPGDGSCSAVLQSFAGPPEATASHAHRLASESSTYTMPAPSSVAASTKVGTLDTQLRAHESRDWWPTTVSFPAAMSVRISDTLPSLETTTALPAQINKRATWWASTSSMNATPRRSASTLHHATLSGVARKTHHMAAAPATRSACTLSTRPSTSRSVTVSCVSTRQSCTLGPHAIHSKSHVVPTMDDTESKSGAEGHGTACACSET
mmetsp:Transcript_7396/g.23121  ORF Transcript_7396/g.23121 Transcript_7396/m.23121 type:complete len:306 (+) Transcript_7396:99-1016(+)